MYFEKIASESHLLADEIIKVASEEINGMDAQDVYEEMISDLKEAGYDINGVTPENVDWQKVYDFGVNKIAEITSEDIAKVASGASVNYETGAAAKAVAPFLTNDGVANFGSAFGAGNGPIGSLVHAGIDKHVFGGWGDLIGKPAYAENAVNASGKINGLLSSTNMKLASEDPNERMEAFREVLNKTAADEGQTLDEYVYDLGMEALVNEIKNENLPQGKVADWLQPELTFFESRKKETEFSKKAEEEAFSRVETVATENGVDPVDVVLDYGIQKAAEYIEEFLKDATIIGAETRAAARARSDKYQGKIPGMTKDTPADVQKALKKMDIKSKGVTSFYGEQAKGKLNNFGDWIKKPSHAAAVGGGALLAGGGAYALSKAFKKKDEEKKEASEVTATSQTEAILKLAQEKLGLANQINK